MQQDSHKIAIYSRKSKFTGKGESIENQIELCKQHIKIHNQDIIDEDIIIFEDEGYSGGNTCRPQFQNMMKQIRTKQIKAIICYRLDRISRNVGDFAKLKEELDDYNVTFTSIRDDFDTSTPGGRAMMMMVSVFAQLERETTAERIRDNMHELAKSGRWLGGNTPTGYKSTQIVGSVDINGKERKAYKLNIINKEAEIVKLIFNKFLETNSLTKTDTYLLQNRIKTKNEKDFTRFSIRSILQNPVYLIADEDAWNYFESLDVEIFANKSDFDGKHGVIAYNKTVQKTGKANKIRNIDEWIIAVGKHKGIIKGNDWIKAQKQLEQNKSKSYRKPKSNVALLSGLLYCGSCGDFMRPKLSQRVNASGEKIYSYLCETKERSRLKNCNIKNPNGNELDKAVCNQIKLLSEDSSKFIEELKSAQKKLENTTEEHDKTLSDYKKELQNNENQIQNLVNSIAKLDNSPALDYITKEINELHEKNNLINNKILELEQLSLDNCLPDAEIETLKALLCSFAKTFDIMDIEQKRSALRVFIRKIIWDGENVHIILFGDSEDDIDFNSFDNENLEPKRAYCETYPLIAALNIFKDVNYAPFSAKWRLFNKLSNNLYILCNSKNNRNLYCPMYIHSFRFIQLHKLTEIEKFNIKYSNPDMITSMADKLKYYRYKSSLLQRQVAEYAGIDVSTYINYENPKHEYYPIDKIELIAKLFKVDTLSLLDSYNNFLYYDQGRQIKQLRKRMKLTQSKFAKLYDVSNGTIKRWENNKARISKNMWLKMFEI